MTIPQHNLILVTADKKHIQWGHPMDRFKNALEQLDACLAAGRVWNQEFQTYKSHVSRACEHAQHIASDACDRRSGPHYDARDDIGYAFSMNQAAKLSRNLKKLSADKITPAIQTYIETLDQITGLWNYLGQFKTLIVKGRKPAENPKPVDVSNMGTCTCCGNLQKLDKHQKMVHHGFRISDGHGYFGFRAGSCFGVGFLPYEFSCEGNRAFVGHLQLQLRNARSSLKTLEAAPETLVVIRPKKENLTLTKGTPEYQRTLDGRIAEVKHGIKMLQNEVKQQKKLIEDWKLVPLRDGTVKA